jgi:hypothetical protein
MGIQPLMGGDSEVQTFSSSPNATRAWFPSTSCIGPCPWSWVVHGEHSNHGTTETGFGTRANMQFQLIAAALS